MPGKGYQWSTVTFVNYDGLTNGRVLPHEVGHCFYLHHDFSTDENVTRIFGNAGYNAPDYGDRIWDTPASKIWELNQYNSNLEYVGGDIDTNTLLPSNDPERFYKTYAPRLNNFMHVHDGNSLQAGYFFTPGQGRRMRWAMDVAITNGFPMYAHAEVGIKELFQPFDSHTIPGEAVIIIEKDDNEATVCHPRIDVHRFQKGFNYTFAPNGATEVTASPDDLTAIVGQTGYFNIKIEQLGVNDTGTAEVVGTDGLICEDEEFEEGFVYALGLMGTTPISIVQLNEMQVKDPAEYEQLLQQYYNVLKKVTTSGAILEKIIYKP